MDRQFRIHTSLHTLECFHTLAKMAHPPLLRAPPASDRRRCQVAHALEPRPWQSRNPRRRQPPAGLPPLRISQNFRKKINKFQKVVYTKKQKEMVYTRSQNFKNPWCIVKVNVGPWCIPSKLRNIRTVLVYTKDKISKNGEFPKISRFWSWHFFQAGAARPKSLYTISSVLPAGDPPKGRF